jgi:hypothetical protein
VQGGQQGIAVAGPGVDQRVPGGLVVPVDDRLAGRGVVVTIAEHRPQPPPLISIGGGEQAPDRRPDQRDGVHCGDRVI